MSLGHLRMIQLRVASAFPAQRNRPVVEQDRDPAAVVEQDKDPAAVVEQDKDPAVVVEVRFRLILQEE